MEAWSQWMLPNSVNYWLSEAEKDCFFIVGPEDEETERIGATKIFLMGHSVPLRSMLQDSDLAEKGDIRITDIDPETFRNFLRCCYGGSNNVIPRLNFEKLVKLLYVTDKYLASEITTKIIERLREMLSFDNLFIALSHPVCYQNQIRLTSDISEIVKFNFKKMAMDERFLDLQDTAISWILQQESLTVKEIDIWNETIRWAKNKTGSDDGKVLRSYIFDLLKHFRFSTMEYTEFWEYVVPSEILLDEEVKDICHAFATGVPCSIEHLNPNNCNRYIIANVSEHITSNFIGNPIYAFISCKVNEIRSCLGPWKNGKYSTTYRWAGHFWAMRILKIKSNRATKTSQKKYALSVYVVCRGESSTWKCPADVDITLNNQRGKPDVRKQLTETFTEIDCNWGFEVFQDWDSLIDPDNGFVQESTMFLEAKIKLRK